MKERLLGTGGCFSGATSLLGSWQVCHNLCLGAIALLSILGITLTGMPFLFLQDYALPFWLIAVSLLSVTLFLRLRGMKCVNERMLLLNSGLIVAGMPFFVEYSTSFYLIGGFLVAFSIFLFIKERTSSKIYIPTKVIVPGVIMLFLIPMGTQWFNADNDTGANSVAQPLPQSPEEASLNLSSNEERAIDFSSPRENLEGGVRITITPINVTDILTLEVSLNTHSVDLDRYNLTELAYLKDGSGNVYKPLSWESDGGGHHISGILKFSSLNYTQGFEIVIENIAGIKERNFTW
ncbi:MAG TPA: hypothetical protein HA257_01370 [Candidatus Methanoperedenaceae archaeon]|nr:hypothetical protein [Candidatus Methanoperedenaceae archaeon]